MERLAAHWDAPDAPMCPHTQVTDPAPDPMVVDSLRLPRDLSVQLRKAVEARDMRRWIWPANGSANGSRSSTTYTASEFAGQMEDLAARLRAS